jgi:diaminopimelate epimerase
MWFTKMHGLGNDFVLISSFPSIPEHAATLAKRMCDRHRGIGADGLVFMIPSEQADIAMRIFNADGTMAEQCGNAVRCVAKYYYERISDVKNKVTIETKVGVQTVWLETENGLVDQVRVDMGIPELQASQIPVKIDVEKVVRYPLKVKDQELQITAVSMGNPHIVIEVEDAFSYPVESWGPILENHPLFPRKANVEFITIHSPEEITMRVWERGVGQTMACGSGACATLVAGVLLGKCQRQAVVHLLGGDLQIEWSEIDNHVYMTGPANFVFEGEWLL